MNVSDAYKALGAALVAAGQMDGGSAAPPAAARVFYTDNGDGTVYLPVSGHTLPKAKPENGEGIMAYYGRVAASIGADPQAAGSLAGGNAAVYNLSKTNDKGADWAVLVDAFVVPEAYGVGKAGDPPVVAKT